MNAAMYPNTKRERNAEILRRHLLGESHPEIAKDFGLTRERVRQIVSRSGVEARGEQKKCGRAPTRKESIVLELAVSGKLSAADIAERTGISYDHVRNISSKHGIVLQKTRAARLDAYKRAAGDVLLGASYWRAASKRGLHVRTLMEYCRKVGISSQHCAFGGRS